MLLWCYGAIHKWIGKFNYSGYTIDSNISNPLQFKVTKDKGYVYIGGEGTVTTPMPFGQVLQLPRKDQAESKSKGYPNTITFDNHSGETATVKLVGPTNQLVDVPKGQSITVNVAAGEYSILVRYGSSNKYSYTKGDPFKVMQNDSQYSAITITLHKVVDGNYSTQPSSQKEFDTSITPGRGNLVKSKKKE